MREIVAADYPMTGRRVSREEAIEALPRQPLQGRAGRGHPGRTSRSRSTPSASSPTSAAAATPTRPARSARSSCSRSPARTGAATRTTPMLQRIYGTAFPTPQELDDYLAFLEEAAKRDHRKLGAELDLYHIDEMAGGRADLLAPQGRADARHRRAVHPRRACASAATCRSSRRTSCTSTSTRPRATSRTSRDGMFGPIEVEGQRFRLKPMNCPGHILIYKSDARSYRDLPIRYSEFGTVYRFELSGTHARPDPRARLHPGRRAPVLHPRAAPGRVRADARRGAAPDGRLRLHRLRVFPEHARAARRRPTRSPRTRSAARSSRTTCPTPSTKAAARSTGPSSTSTCTTRSAASGSSARCRSTSPCPSAST